MNIAKTTFVKEQFDKIQVSVNDVNNSLNDIQFSSSFLKSYAKDSLCKIEEVECKIDQTTHSTQGLITELSNKFEKLNPSKVDKPVPAYFLQKRNVHIQNPVSTVDKFPRLFPKEVGQSSQKDSSEKVSLASLFKESDKESETQAFPVYEPLESQFTRYSAPNLSGMGKLPKSHGFYPDCHR